MTAGGSGVLDVEILGKGFNRWDFLLELILRAFGAMEGVIDPPSSALRLTPDQLAQKAETETCFAIMQDGLPLACLFCDRRGDTLYVGKLAVDPVHHGKGLATRLIQEAEALARRLGCRQLELQTRVELVDNHRFFAARGFRREGEGAHDGYMRPTWIVMRRQVYPA